MIAPANGASSRSAAVPHWYTLAWLLALPLAALYLLWRSLRQAEYRWHWAERFFGAGPAPAPGKPVIWVHAVSVGETRAAQPLIEELARHHPQAQFVLTHMTPTGRAAGADLLRALAGRVVQRYLPYDLPYAVRRFLRETRPSVGVLMETEVWPNLLHAAGAQALPVVLANARLSGKSLRRAREHGALIAGAAARLRAIGAQSEADRERISQIYAGPIRVTGNCKFDLLPDAQLLAQGQELRARLQGSGAHRPVWLFASTREGEERLILDALAAQPHVARPQLLFVPRHPQRFDAVAELLRASGRPVLRRAQWLAPGSDSGATADAIWLGDSMGEMPLYYAMADVALIGGSLLPLGGQNLIEACACACPVVLGPHMFNFAQASADAIAAGAARQVPDAASALLAMGQISADASERARMAAAALAFSSLHGGATARTVALIEEALGEDR